MKKAISFLMVLVACLSLGMQTFAFGEEAIQVEPENKQFVIGSRNDAVVDNDSIAPSSRASSLLFSITTSGGTGFRNLLVSGSNKTFEWSDLTNGGLRISGTLSSDDTDTDKYLRAGYCIYVASSDEYKAADYAKFSNGVYSTAFFETNFWPTYTYYGFASKDTVGDSYAQGTLYFYNASN